jgi:hypothetical protein
VRAVPVHRNVWIVRNRAHFLIHPLNSNRNEVIYQKRAIATWSRNAVQAVAYYRADHDARSRSGFADLLQLHPSF